MGAKTRTPGGASASNAISVPKGAPRSSGSSAASVAMWKPEKMKQRSEGALRQLGFALDSNNKSDIKKDESKLFEEFKSDLTEMPKGHWEVFFLTFVLKHRLTLRSTDPVHEAILQGVRFLFKSKLVVEGHMNKAITNSGVFKSLGDAVIDVPAAPKLLGEIVAVALAEGASGALLKHVLATTVMGDGEPDEFASPLFNPTVKLITAILSMDGVKQRLPDLLARESNAEPLSYLVARALEIAIAEKDSRAGMGREVEGLAKVLSMSGEGGAGASNGAASVLIGLAHNTLKGCLDENAFKALARLAERESDKNALAGVAVAAALAAAVKGNAKEMPEV